MVLHSKTGSEHTSCIGKAETYVVVAIVGCVVVPRPAAKNTVGAFYKMPGYKYMTENTWLMPSVKSRNPINL